MEFRPFEDEQELKKIEKKRAELIEELARFELGPDEKRFILRRISIITEKLMEATRYAKSPK